MIAAGPRASLKPIVFVMGKGGVGKTTIAAGLAAIAAATTGGATLVEFGDGEAGRRALGTRRGAGAAAATSAGTAASVEHVVLHPADALQRGAAPLFGSALVAKLALGNFAIRPLLQAAPAIRELALLECVRQVAAERAGARVVVDMPATGHAVAWLRVAAQGRTFLESGPLFELCDRVVREVVSPDRASVVVVTLAERLVIEETLELCASMSSEVGLAVDRIVVNRVAVPVALRTLDDVRAVAAQPGPLGEAARALERILLAREAQARESAAAMRPLDAGGHALRRVALAASDPTVDWIAQALRAQGEA